MPWKDDVSGILTLFLGGQETGSAWGDVLFGDVAPSGHLPLMLPETEEDQIHPTEDGDTPIINIEYTEKLETSYRNKAFKAAFPFGHGLTYTEFEYGETDVRPCHNDATGSDEVCVHINLTNIGSTAAKAIPQLYMEFPEEAGYPTPVLKGFQKTELIQPGMRSKVTFRLTARDFSFFNGFDSAGYPRWEMVEKVTVMIGASSADIRATKTAYPREADAKDNATLI